MIIRQICTVKVSSSHFKNGTLTYSGATPTLFYHDGNGNLFFTLPYNSNNYTFIVKYTPYNINQDYYMYFLATPPNSSLPPQCCY